MQNLKKKTETKKGKECLKIFVVEDDKDIRETFVEILQNEGYGVESFANGEDAIHRLYEKPEPCLILLDMMMPIMNGEVFMEHFHKLPATILPIPVFLASANSNKECSDKIGCRGFIKKPIDIEPLLLIVENYCHKNGQLSDGSWDMEKSKKAKPWNQKQSSDLNN